MWIGLLLGLQPGLAQGTGGTIDMRDGQHDFDFEIGTWQTKVSRLQKPLSGSTAWVEYEGTTVVRKIWDGRANLVELDVSSPVGRIEALSLRLYNPETRKWSLNFASSRGGTLSPPTIGEFKNGRGEFFSQESLDGKPILVRFVISDITPTSCHFEQAFSADGGKTWEVNWIATDTRVVGGEPARGGDSHGDRGSGGDETAPTVISRVEPALPEIEKGFGSKHEVLLHVLVGQDGRVKNVKVIRGVTGLNESAMDAVKKWVFRPGHKSGQPTAMWTQVPITFQL